MFGGPDPAVTAEHLAHKHHAAVVLGFLALGLLAGLAHCYYNTFCGGKWGWLSGHKEKRGSDKSRTGRAERDCEQQEEEEDLIEEELYKTGTPHKIRARSP